MIDPVDLGVCRGYAYAGDPARTAIVLPGRMVAGMPIAAFAIEAVRSRGWRAIQVWDALDDSDANVHAWVHERLDAATRWAEGSDELLVIGKSMSTVAAGPVADRGLRAVWLTPLLNTPEVVDELRRRTAPALLVGGTEDPAWDDALARELSDDVLSIEGADHGLAKIEHLQQIVDAIAAFV